MKDERHLDHGVPPRTLETILGAALIVLIIAIGLAHQAVNGGGAHQPDRPAAATPPPSHWPSPHG